MDMEASTAPTEKHYEVIVIGSGFGGSVVACRTAQKWKGNVLVLERGKRYGRNSFPRSPDEIRENLWEVDGQSKGKPLEHQDRNGLFDVRRFRHMHAIVAAGVGGGSLIYANVILRPPKEVFTDGAWGAAGSVAGMDLYYCVAKSVLGARTVPTGADRPLGRTEVFQSVALQLRRTSTPAEVAVFFGKYPDGLLSPGASSENRFGATQTSCTYCGECDIGCNLHAKNTLDLNYLYAAEHTHGATVRANSLVDRVCPRNAAGDDDPGRDGGHGYRVYYRDLGPDGEEESVTATRVVLGAGALGSTELLLRCREIHNTLPNVSKTLGTKFSGNGDFLSIVAGANQPTHPEDGPVITQYIDFNLFDNPDPKRAFIMEDAGFPNMIAWFIEGIKPKFFLVRTIWRTARDVVPRWLRGRSGGRIGYQVRDEFGGNITNHSAALLCMGIDNAMGRLVLDRNGWINLRWPVRRNRKLYRAIVAAAKSFGKKLGTRLVVSAPNWYLPYRRNITVHALGGCPLGTDSNTGVVSNAEKGFGAVFGYQNLFVADGAIVPVALGANPSLTIAALAERVANTITGLVPDDTLGVPAP